MLSFNLQKTVFYFNMTNFVPIVPLETVVFPGEECNLHITEMRYQQLIQECFNASKPFGVLAIIQSSLQEMGTLVHITEIVQVYNNASMDVKTKGLHVFRILEVIHSIPNKLYSGAIVNYPDVHHESNKRLLLSIVQAIKELHRLLHIHKEFPLPYEALSSYDLAHHAGLSLEEEYELLSLLREDQRLEYLKRHLRKVIPIIAATEKLKERIRLNGHFKNLKGL